MTIQSPKFWKQLKEQPDYKFNFSEGPDCSLEEQEKQGKELDKESEMIIYNEKYFPNSINNTTDNAE